jgi:putative ABC transport system substrate-binding protein
MNRREAVLGLLALGAAPQVLAQAATKVSRIGVLFVTNREPLSTVLRESLASLGYVEGRNIQIEIVSAEGKPDLLPKLAAELVRKKVDVIVAAQTPAVFAARAATRDIPIVMVAGDPVGTGLVTSLARPGGNITGISSTTAELGGKVLQLIRELLPAAKRVAVLANAADPFTKPFLAQMREPGKLLGIEIPIWRVRETDDFGAAFAEMAKRQVDAVVLQPSLPRKAVIGLAMKHRLPAVSPQTAFAEAGALFSYAAKLEELYRAPAGYVDKILRGAKPGDLPIEQASKFELVINLKTAKALGIAMPQSLLLRADTVIE